MILPRNMMKPRSFGWAAAIFLIFFLSTAAGAAKIDTGKSSGAAASPAAAVEKENATSSQGSIMIKAPEESATSGASPEAGVETGSGDKKTPAVTTDDGESTQNKQKTKGSAKKKRSERASKKIPDQDKYVTLDFDNVNIEVFAKFVSELTGKNFIIDEKVKGKVTILSPKKIPLRDVYKVFLSVLEINGFATVPVGDMIKIVPSSVAREKSVETRTQQKDGVESDDRIVTQIISLERANPDEVKRVLDPIVSKTSSVLSYAPAGILIITDYLSNIRRLQDIVKALDVEGAGEQITYLPLQNASASEVVKSLTSVFQQRRANMTPIRLVADTRTNSVIILASVGDTESVRKLIAMMDKVVPRGDSNIQVFRLQNAVADDLAKVLNNIVKESAAAGATGASGAAKTAATITPTAVYKNVQIVPDKATNTLIIMAEREDYKVLEGIIKQLDVPRAMVYIEALIMEVNTTKDFKLGVEWSAIKDTGSVQGIDGSGSAAFASSGTGTLSSLATTTDSVTSLAFPNGFAMGIIGAGIEIGGVLFPTIGAMVQAYKTDSDVSILSTPQILTLDNEEAEINVGSNVPYLTKQETTASTTDSAVNYNTYEYKDVGVILNITPNINQENFVRLKISQQVTKVISGADKAMPTTLKRTAKTSVVVKDKETLVIGGLVGDSTDEGTSKVPLLGDIPILGWLFKSKTVTREKTNLYVFLTPHIVRTQKEAAELYQSKRETMGRIEEGVIKLDGKKETYPSEVKASQEIKTPANP